MTQLDNTPAIFLGLSDFVESRGAPFPIGEVDLFRLSHHKFHIVFPAVISSHYWVILFHIDFLKQNKNRNWSVKIFDEQDNEIGYANFSSTPTTIPQEQQKNTSQTKISLSVRALPDTKHVLFHFKIPDTIIVNPGRYVVRLIRDDETTEIGSAYFHYHRTNSLTPDQIKAIESDPSSVKAICFELGCKSCDANLNTYTGLQRSIELESSGWTWQYDLPETFTCHCGKTHYSLKYLKDSMHGLLRGDLAAETSGLSYVRRYGHTQIRNIVDKFTDLLDSEKKEEPIQKFIEDHPTLLARFTPKRLFSKPNIIGLFNADFAILDSTNQLWLIEIEKPTLKLFKKNDGHATQDLMHAYNQVTDWLHQYNKHPGAVLDCLKLKQDEIFAVRGAVIAGRSKTISHAVLQRHHSNPPYPNIEFMTLDDLSASLLQISKKLA